MMGGAMGGSELEWERGWRMGCEIWGGGVM